MRIRALSREEAETYRPSEPSEVCFSITDLEASSAELSPAFEDVLRLSFSDLDKHHVQRLGFDADLQREPPMRALQPQQAEEILDFYHHHADAHRLIVHCEAGVSRSVGVARALAELEGATRSESRKIMHGRGNLLVRERILTAAGRRAV